MSRERKDKGDWGEDLACNFYLERGGLILERNYFCRVGEIDLIVCLDGVLIFVEVRTRSGSGFMEPFESVDARKIRKIRRAATYYYTYVWEKESVCQFDVISVTGQPDDYELVHIEQAFM